MQKLAKEKEEGERETEGGTTSVRRNGGSTARHQADSEQA